MYVYIYQAQIRVLLSHCIRWLFTLCGKWYIMSFIQQLWLWLIKQACHTVLVWNVLRLIPQRVAGPKGENSASLWTTTSRELVSEQAFPSLLAPTTTVKVMSVAFKFPL